MKLITRREYLEGACTFEEFYGQFVDEDIINLVRDRIGEDRIKASTEPCFHDIPIEEWTQLHYSIQAHCREKVEVALDMPLTYGLADSVCIAKAAAMQIKQEASDERRVA